MVCWKPRSDLGRLSSVFFAAVPEVHENRRSKTTLTTLDFTRRGIRTGALKFVPDVPGRTGIIYRVYQNIELNIYQQTLLLQIVCLNFYSFCFSFRYSLSLFYTYHQWKIGAYNYKPSMLLYTKVVRISRFSFTLDVSILLTPANKILDFTINLLFR